MKINTFLKLFLLNIFILIIKAYKLIISPLFPSSCRYYPTCSTYSIDALKKHGLIKGFFLTLKRIIRCNPINKGGYDPVPESFQFFK